MFGLGLGLGIHRHSSANPYAFPFISRVESDGGTIRDKAALLNLTYYLQSMMPNTKLLYCPELGVKLRTSGVNNYVTTLYDISSNMLDGTQTTAINQPYLSGNIAPNEKYAIKSPNGQTPELRINFNPISFEAGKSWSVSYLVNWNCDNYTNTANIWQTLISGNGVSGGTKINLNHAGGRRVTFISKSGVFFNVGGVLNKIIGKRSILTIVGNYPSSKIELYIDGKAFGYTTSSAMDSEFSSVSFPSGTVSYCAIRDIALSPTQVADEYNYLRSIFPEIESVQIGTQTWATSNCEMTCTPQGRIIYEMQAAVNVEKITNVADREFSSDTGFWTKGSSWNISGGSANVNKTNEDLVNSMLSFVSNMAFKWYKITVTIINYTSGALFFRTQLGNLPLYSTKTNISGNGTHTIYILNSANGGVGLHAGNSPTQLSIDNISIQELGWSDSTNLYNEVYANTEGTAEQKEYAAVKAAAMWCHYNNDPALGAVYGKLYNWYAVRLLQMDIDYYNAANPTTPWGWRVPTSDDFTTLSSYLGGEAVSGGKMKKEGTTYWLSPNNGADNSSGFSAIGCGYRMGTGEFATLNSNYYPVAINKSRLYYLRTTDYIFGVQGWIETDVTRGLSIRLIKS